MSDKPTILVQLDTDPQPSVFDAVVAVDAGVDHLFRHGGVRPEGVRDLVHGALFTRGPADLHRTALFVGGSDVAAGEAVLEAIKATFFAGFRVSVLLDANGCNTTAAAAALEVEALDRVPGRHPRRVRRRRPRGDRPRRPAGRAAPREGAARRSRSGSRRLDRAGTTADRLRAATGREFRPFATDDPEATSRGLEEAAVVVSAGAAGATLLPEAVRRRLTKLKVMVDLNAVSPAGIEGVKPTDKGAERDGVRAWGALGVGGTKMKIHKKAIRELFAANDKVLDAEEVLAIGRSLE